MKNFFKLLGIAAFVAVIGFFAISCKTEDDNNENNDYELLDGVWNRGDIVVTFSNGIGVFTQINSDSGWIDVLINGKIRIGDQKFKNLKKSGNLQWSGKERTYDVMITDTDWTNSTITLSADGQTLQTDSPNTTPPITTYTKQ